MKADFQNGIKIALLLLLLLLLLRTRSDNKLKNGGHIPCSSELVQNVLVSIPISIRDLIILKDKLQ